MGFSCWIFWLDFQQGLRLSRQEDGLSLEDLDFLSHHVAPNTASGYGYTYKTFSDFCDRFATNPYSGQIPERCMRVVLNTGQLTITAVQCPNLTVGCQEFPLANIPWFARL